MSNLINTLANAEISVTDKVQYCFEEIKRTSESAVVDTISQCISLSVEDKLEIIRSSTLLVANEQAEEKAKIELQEKFDKMSPTERTLYKLEEAKRFAERAAAKERARKIGAKAKASVAVLEKGKDIALAAGGTAIGSVLKGFFKPFAEGYKKA